MIDEHVLREHEAANRAYWNGMADDWAREGERRWAMDAPVWGQFDVPDADLALLPDDLAGEQAIELGCGTGYVSGWMARRGAEVTGVDVSEQQLATARRLAGEHGVELALHHASAEAVPVPDEAFSFAVSEYGASIWCEPAAWLTEAARLLRPGGRLVFLANHPLVMATAPLDGSLPITRTLVRPWFGTERYDWREAADDPGGISFCPSVAGWFAHLRDAGFTVTDYSEVQAPADAPEGRTRLVETGWARDFPTEHVFWASRDG